MKEYKIELIHFSDEDSNIAENTIRCLSDSGLLNFEPMFVRLQPTKLALLDLFEIEDVLSKDDDFVFHILRVYDVDSSIKRLSGRYPWGVGEDEKEELDNEEIKG